MVTAETFATLDALPADSAGLFERAPFQSSRAWWRCLVAAALPPAARPRFVLCRDGARPLALVALRLDAGGRLGGLTTPYTTAWAPLLATADEVPVAAAAAAFGAACRGWPVLSLDCLDAGWPALPAWLLGLRRAGWWACRYDHFGNWHEPTRGLGWDDYLRARPGALRGTIRRKLSRAEAGLRFEVARTPAEAAAALGAYRDVYRRSWKPPEPFADLDAALLAEAAAAGVLRLGLLWRGGVAIATQYWIVTEGIATVLKLAHDEAFRAVSPGTSLTAWMVRALLDEERVEALDFGRGDDAYKAGWARERRQRIGLLLARPWRPAGAAALVRQALGGAARRWGRPSTGAAVAHPV